MADIKDMYPHSFFEFKFSCKFYRRNSILFYSYDVSGVPIYNYYASLTSTLYITSYNVRVTKVVSQNNDTRLLAAIYLSLFSTLTNNLLNVFLRVNTDYLINPLVTK